MREMVAVLAVLGGCIEAIAAIGGPQLAGIGMDTGQPAPAMETGPLVVGLAAAALSIIGGWLVNAGRNAQGWGLVLVATALTGATVVGPSTGWYPLGAIFTLLAGLVALLIRRPRSAAP